MTAALVERGVCVRVLVFWKHAHESASLGLPIEYLSAFAPQKLHAIWQLPILLVRYTQYIYKLQWAQNNLLNLLLTHYTTFPFAWLSFSLKRFCFNQDVEWMFVPPGPLRALLRRMILFTSRRSRVLTTNRFISQQYEKEEVIPFAQASIWAQKSWRSTEHLQKRSIDIVMLLRNGRMKRLDLYLELLREIRENSSWTCALITPDSDIYAQIEGLAKKVVLRPANEEIRKLYQDSKIFVLLSDTEGFGLPPLEAMGSGCVPLCRDSGGVQCYLQGPLESNLIAPEETMAEMFQHLQNLLANPGRLTELSTIALQTFEEGLRLSRVEREASFDKIAKDLLT
jgi:glycosyltransferase involved in cell wall biosynthesis